MGITIIVPLYNKADTILRALNSILVQSFKGYEVIIVNDGSTDNSKKIVDEWILSLDPDQSNKFKLVFQNNFGVSEARNNGVSLAKFEYIAFLDADDYWKENHLENISNLISNYGQDVDLFSCGIMYLKGTNFSCPRVPKSFSNQINVLDYFKVALISHGFVNASSVCCKRSSLLEFPFPAHMSNFEDGITWARVCRDKGFAFSPTRTSIYVLNNNEGSSNINFENYIRYRDILYTINTIRKSKLRLFLLAETIPFKIIKKLYLACQSCSYTAKSYGKFVSSNRIYF